jgi:hypothetical protein
MACRALYIILLTSLGLLHSCEEPLETDLNNSSRLVIYSNFTSDTDLHVSVTKTRSYLTQSPIEYISNATVFVFEGGNLIESLEFVAENPLNGKAPYYRSRKLMPQPDLVYTIKVIVPGYKTVTATNSIPKAIQIETMEFSNEISDAPKMESQVDFNLNLTINDPAIGSNFYHLVFYQEFIPFSISPEGDTLQNPVILFPVSAQANDPTTPLVTHYDKKSYLLKDESFNGKKIFLSFEGSYTFKKSQFIPGNFLVELRTVSEDYYLYYATVSRQVLAVHPLAESVVIYKNIENGEGIFAGFSSSFNSSRLKL